MENERTEYKCNKCNTSQQLLIAHTYCVCGGKLYPVNAAKDLIDTMLSGIGKGK